MIRSVFRPSRLVDGKRVISRLYSGRLRLDGEAKAKTIPLHVTDKRVAEQKLAEIVREREMQAAGIGVSRGVRDAMIAPIELHVGRFLDELKGKGRAPRTLKTYRNLMESICRCCGWKTVRDISAESFTTWRAASGLRPKYVNDFLGCLRGFVRWMERNQLMLSNPLRFVDKVRNDSEGTYRRSLSPDEISRLLSVAPASRAWVYLVIIYTGLRRHELNRLTWGHFHMEAPDQFVELPASITKNRKSDRQPLRPEVVQALRSVMPENSMPFEWVFRGKVPSPAKLRRDLVAAGIPVVDERGQRLDVHALRKTFGTMLAVAGVTPQDASKLMRHSDIRLTMRIYTDAGQLPLAQDVARLPSYSLPKTNAQLHAQVDAQTAVVGGLVGSQPLANGRELANQQDAEIVVFSPAESSSVATDGNKAMVGAARFELKQVESKRADGQDVTETSTPVTHT